ncbi:hypothetical protein RZS28_05180 [Methylocapsa polymorpha]|uniref:C-type lysozyme inhibitor domain-containing protein n=1 Tax=Methylocapsa polymorpha TaxID=3080828 RepID=A0ABZ0HTR2_9HYPH|nr:hypothetical protein RZS28_05180 [Methylocapsa sp. RX1]
MGLELGKRAKWALAGVSLACVSLSAASTSASAAGVDLDLICSGNSYQKDGPFPSVETASLKLSGKKPVLIGLPGSDQPVKARTIANNAIQLKFASGNVTAEYFYFTGDLFLIRADGRFTKLLCKPA